MQGMMSRGYARRKIDAPASAACLAASCPRIPLYLRHAFHLLHSRYPKLGLEVGRIVESHCRVVHRGTIAAAAVAEAPEAYAEDNTNSEQQDLERFLSWLVANGVKGVGEEGSKVALFASEGGERGLMCEEPIAAGEVVLEVPLRLALTDHPEDEESNQLLYPDAPWSVRLACKLLRHLAAGDQSPWAPYMRVLPTRVPAPLETFSWEDMAALRYPAAQEALHAADWLRADAYGNASEEAVGSLGEEAFRWALSVVHSRTFANAAEGGGVGVRMLVPLVDLLNHGGDQMTVAPAGTRGQNGRAVATDNVRWDLVPPERSTTGGWAMQVSATAGIRPGQEVLLSYGERSNDDFFLHYGFVPFDNPHDDAVLWPDLEAALDWHYERFGVQQMPPEQAQPLYLEALEAGRREQRPELRPQQQQQQVPPEVARQLAQIRVVTGGQVDAAVIRAFSVVSGGDAAAAEQAVAYRCVELLRTMAGGPWPLEAGSQEQQGSQGQGQDDGGDVAIGEHGGGGGLLADLAALVADAGTADEVLVEAGQAGYWATQLQGYCKALIPKYAMLLPEGPAAAAALKGADPTSSSTAGSPNDSNSSSTSSAGGGIRSKYGLPPQAASAAPAAAARAATPLAGLVRALLPGARTGGLTGPQRLSAAFRAYKQMVLWDVVLSSDVDSADLAAFGKGH